MKENRDVIVVFTDMETDDVAFLRGLRKLHPNSKIVLVIGESVHIGTKFGIAKAMGFTDILPGLPSDKDYPPMYEDNLPMPYPDDIELVYSQERILEAIRNADVVVGIKPMRELVGCTEVFDAEFYMSGSFNLRSIMEKDKPHPAHGLRHNFPGKFVWVETFMVVGEKNSVTEIKNTKDNIFGLVRKRWNTRLFKYATEAIRGSSDPEDLSPKEIASITRKMKIIANIMECPRQFIVADVLVLMAMQGEFVEKAFFTGANEAGYSQFSDMDNQEGTLPVEIMKSDDHAAVLTRVNGLLKSLFAM